MCEVVDGWALDDSGPGGDGRGYIQTLALGTDEGLMRAKETCYNRVRSARLVVLGDGSVVEVKHGPYKNNGGDLREELRAQGLAKLTAAERRALGL